MRKSVKSAVRADPVLASEPYPALARLEVLDAPSNYF